MSQLEVQLPTQEIYADPDGITFASETAMSTPQISSQKLCYLSADRIAGPFQREHRVDVRGREGRKLGSLEGIVIDPEAGQLRYLVVDSGMFSHHHYLLPFPRAQVDPDRRALRVDVDKNELAHCSEFDRASFPDFCDEDVPAALFPSRRQEVSS